MVYSLDKGIFMSPLTSNKREIQRWSQISAHHSVIKPKRKCLTLIGCALMFGGTSVALMGCQSSHTLSSSVGTSGELIDFNTADTVQNQAQGRAFNSRLNANNEHYQQLFDQSKSPNTETQAKLRLLAAIRQHLATEQVAVSQASYHATPFIQPDSIDAGSSSFLRTMIDLYTYRNSDADGYSDYDYNYEHDETDDYSEEAAEAEAIDNYDDDDEYVYAVDSAAEAVGEASDYYSDEAQAVEYDADGYDEYGYDRDGYDQDGYDQEGYDQDGYNEYGNQQSGEYSSSSSGILSKMSRINPREFLDDYEDMQVQKQQQAIADMHDKGVGSSYSGVMGKLLDMLHHTPEQIEAMNTYQYQYLTVNSVSQYKPQQKQLQSVYSYDYSAPTMSSSMQIPMAFDFINNRLSIDPSAFMPLVALTNPENTPLPSQMASHTVDFGLPESITSQIPPAVVYDAVIAALQDSMAELAPEYFSAVDIREDQFAKQVGADRAVKVYFGSKQSGEMIGKMLKYISQSLQDYIDTNPDKYPDDATLKTAIAKIQQYNKGYQSADVGALLQLIEAIGPVSFNHTNYYYLDSSDRLLAKQQRVNVGGDLFGAQTSVLNQTRYDHASFYQHALTPLLAQSFGPKAPPALDGNAWIQQIKQQKDKLREARYARYDYEDSDYDDSDIVESGTDWGDTDDCDVEGSQ